MSRFYGIYPNFNVDFAGEAPQTIIYIAALFSHAKSILLTLIVQIGAKLFLISVKKIKYVLYYYSTTPYQTCIYTLLLSTFPMC